MSDDMIQRNIRNKSNKNLASSSAVSRRIFLQGLDDGSRDEAPTSILPGEAIMADERRKEITRGTGNAMDKSGGHKWKHSEIYVKNNLF